MNPNNDRKYIQVNKTALLIAILVLGAGLFGWWLGRSDKSQTAQSSNSAQNVTPSTNIAGPDVKSLVAYRLPDGWKESSCPNATGSVFIVPAGASGVDCEANPSAPVKVSVDAGNNDDCNDLQNVQNVRKHICISLYINDKKSLKAETIYNSRSSYKKETTLHAYYINTGKGIVKVEYVYNNSNDYQAGFDELAKSVQAK